MRDYVKEQIIEQYGEESLRKIEDYLKWEATIPVSKILVYADEISFDILGGILTNHSMSVDDALRQLSIDMDTYADEQCWDGWDYEALDLVDVE